MKIAGIIAEYNPFHNGHALHIEKTRGQTKCDAIIVVMDGHFTQRGEPACLDKWSRAKAALENGADAVFELPALFAVRTADMFARGGVEILDGLGADFLSYGCEKELIPMLDTLTDLSNQEPQSVREAIRANLQAGKSHARARGEAYAEYLGCSAELLNSPNAILAMEYRKAIGSCGSRMIPTSIERVGGYHDPEPGRTASASAIRNAVRQGEIALAMEGVPENARDLLKRACRDHVPDDLILHWIRGMSAVSLSELIDMPEGLENRILHGAEKADSLETLIDAVKSKRYTRARITRTIAHAMLGMDAQLAQSNAHPRYARLIGMRRDAAAVIREISIRSRIGIMSDPVVLREDPVFRLECRATDLWALCRDIPEERVSGQEFTHRFVVV